MNLILFPQRIIFPGRRQYLNRRIANICQKCRQYLNRRIDAPLPKMPPIFDAKTPIFEPKDSQYLPKKCRQYLNRRIDAPLPKMPPIFDAKTACGVAPQGCLLMSYSVQTLAAFLANIGYPCLLYTSPSPRD